jgi:hypothetical protein
MEDLLYFLFRFMYYTGAQTVFSSSGGSCITTSTHPRRERKKLCKEKR